MSPPDAKDATVQHLDAIEEHIRSLVVIPSEAAMTAIALWVAHTWTLEAADATPYIVLLSPERRSGKTLLLEVLEGIVRAPWRVASSSEAAMFRKIATTAPTLLLDEIDTIFSKQTSERTEALRAILNAGNRRGSAVARCVGQGAELRVVDFTVYCAKLLAGIDNQGLPDTIRDRAIEIRMQRKAPGEVVRRYRRREVEPEARAISARLSEWAPGAVGVLRGATPELPDELNDRAADAWEPLFAIADLAGWGDRARLAAIELSDQAGTDEAAFGTRLLGKLRELLGTRHAIPTSEILEAVNADEDLPFGAWRGGVGLDGRGLAKLLKPYGISPRTVKLSDGATAKGYHADAVLEQAFTRYLPTISAGASPAAPAAPGDVGDGGDASGGMGASDAGGEW